MTLARFMVITSEPDGTKPRLRFFHNEESARDHARMMTRDLNRDSYVGEVSARFLASRDFWRKQKEREAAAEWSGSPCPDDPDNFFICDKTGERIPA